jgi:hypothetical protein
MLVHVGAKRYTCNDKSLSTCFEFLIWFKANEQVKKVGRVARAICIMKHPIPDTKDSHSVQIILPKKQLKRKSDM